MQSVLLTIALITQAQDPTDAEHQPPAAQREVLGPEQRIWINQRQCWCVAQQVQKGSPNCVGKWRVKYTIADLGDPYGFCNFLNTYRASAGLPPLAYDSNLSAWASQNNAAQSARGLGHFVNPGARQNAGWNYANAGSVFHGWRTSPGHNATLLSWGSRYGIAYGPGPYWTLNVK